MLHSQNKLVINAGSQFKGVSQGSTKQMHSAKFPLSADLLKKKSLFEFQSWSLFSIRPDKNLLNDKHTFTRLIVRSKWRLDDILPEAGVWAVTQAKLAGYTVPCGKTIQPTTSTWDLPIGSFFPSLVHFNFTGWFWSSVIYEGYDDDEMMMIRRGEPGDQSPNKRICESLRHKFGSTGSGQTGQRSWEADRQNILKLRPCSWSSETREENQCMGCWRLPSWRRRKEILYESHTWISFPLAECSNEGGWRRA